MLLLFLSTATNRRNNIRGRECRGSPDPEDKDKDNRSRFLRISDLTRHRVHKDNHHNNSTSTSSREEWAEWEALSNSRVNNNSSMERCSSYMLARRAW